MSHRGLSKDNKHRRPPILGQVIIVATSECVGTAREVTGMHRGGYRPLLHLLATLQGNLSTGALNIKSLGVPAK